MKKGWIPGCLLAIALGAGPAQAAFHLWEVSEVYSNEDGSVQFIEFFTASNGQQFLVNHFVRTELLGETVQEFTFPNSLASPPATANRRFLCATPGFLAVAGIEPDYEIPAGFIDPAAADTINFSDFDAFPLGGLPTDGVLALLDGGSTAVPTPTNFASEVGTIVPEPEGAALGVAAFLALVGLGGINAGARRSR